MCLLFIAQSIILPSKPVLCFQSLILHFLKTTSTMQEQFWDHILKYNFCLGPQRTNEVLCLHLSSQVIIKRLLVWIMIFFRKHSLEMIRILNEMKPVFSGSFLASSGDFQETEKRNRQTGKGDRHPHSLCQLPGSQQEPDSSHLHRQRS